MSKRYAIILNGQGDTEIAFVEQDIFDWVQMEGECPERLRESPEADEVGDLNPTEGSSPDNDRALTLMCLLPSDETFYDTVEAFAHASENGFEIVDSYEGYIY